MENYTGSFGYQWNIHAKTQLDSVTGLPISADRLFATTLWPRSMEGMKILEAGSGAGRFTEVLLGTGAEVHSFDYSDAVDANRANNGHNPKLTLFRGDIFDIRYPPETFDKVICIGVLQHTPDPERAFKGLARQVKPGGELVVDCYARRLTALISWKYVLRPITRRMSKQRLYGIVQEAVPLLLPLALGLHKVIGRVGLKLVPVAAFPEYCLPYSTHVGWSVCDTFDRLSPAFDNPQTIEALKRWFAQARFSESTVERGANGVVGRGRK